VEVRKRDDWVKEWAFPDVHFVIEVSNVDGQAALRVPTTQTFNETNSSFGKHTMLKRDGYDELKEGGWVFPDDTVRFKVAVKSASLGLSKRRRPETEHSARMWEEMAFADMHICAGDSGAQLPCHRAVLALASPVFKAMLASTMKEGLEQQIVLQGASVGTLRIFLEYVYTSSLSEAAMFDLRRLQELLPLAHRYELSDLCGECASGLVDIMSPDNVRDVFGLLATYRDHPKVDAHFQKAMKAAQRDDSLLKELAIGYAAVLPVRAGATGG